LKRFPESTGRHQGRESLRIRGIDQQEIHITIEPQVLKSIVEYQAIDRKSIQDPVTELIAIGANRNDRLGTTLRHQDWLIACLVWADKQALAIRHQQIRIRTCPSIASAENCHPFSLCKKPIGKHNDHRRFSRPTQREIPDTQHRDR
jgi:hypothetical protein